MSTRTGSVQSQSEFDLLSKYTSDLRTRNEAQRVKAAKDLRYHVESEARHLFSEAAKEFMQELHRRIFELIHSPETSDKLGAIRAIDELIELDLEENATNITRFANYLRMVLPNSDQVALVDASRVLGHLARTGGTLTADFVEQEVKRALEWLEDSSRRLASVLVLKELADNAPTLFYVHVATFFDSIGYALRDSKQQVRESAVDALRACLELIGHRESRWRVQWYEKVHDDAQKGFEKNTNDCIHGSLLTLQELLRNAGPFMLNHFDSTCEVVFRYSDSKTPMIRRTVIAIFPALASISTKKFTTEGTPHTYLEQCLQYLCSTLRQKIEITAVYLSIGQVSVAVGNAVAPHLEALVGLIREGISKKGVSIPGEALTCVAMLAKATGSAMTDLAQELLELMFGAGLTEDLSDALAIMAKHIPDLVLPIQRRLLLSIMGILGKASKPKTPVRRASVLSQLTATTPSPAAPVDDSQVILALRTLGSFDFGQLVQTSHVSEHSSQYLDDLNGEIRKEAALTSASLMKRLIANSKKRDDTLLLVCREIVEKLLILGIADTDPNVRHAVLLSLDPYFDRYLAQSSNLYHLLVALNDEVFEIREVVITTVGRLTAKNPALLVPCLRKTVMQLTTEIEFSGDNMRQEESAKLLGHLVRSSYRLMKPYVDSLTKALLPKLRDGNPGVASSVLSVLGELAIAGRETLKPYFADIMPLIMDHLQDQSSLTKREIALRVLGKLVQNTGAELPYYKFPGLLEILLHALKSESYWPIRREVIKLLGILGALEPDKHRVLEQSTESEEAGSSLKPLAMSEVVPGIAPSSVDYFHTVAITANLRILSDSSLSSHHSMVISAMMFIFNSLGTRCIPFLPQVMPIYLQVMKNCELKFLEFLFQHLSRLVGIVKGSISAYLDALFPIIQSNWQETDMLQHIVELLQEVSSALGSDFKDYLPELLPQLLSALHSDRKNNRLLTVKVLHALESFGKNLEDYLYLVIPALVKLFDQIDLPLGVRKTALQVLSRLCTIVSVTDYATRIIHPLTRVLESTAELREEAMQTLSSVARQLGSDYAIFVPTVNPSVMKHGIHHPEYESLVSKILKNQPIPPHETMEDVDEETQTAEEESSVRKLHVNQENLKTAWEASQRSTKDDWVEWMRRFSVELLRESPSPALRYCSALAQVYHPLARELFNASFISCWTHLQETAQEALIRNLEMAFQSPNLPPEIMQTLLSLAEFMEHDEKPLPINPRNLAALAETCHAYAKALHYKELEFHTAPSSTIEALITINNQLHQPAAAAGILTYAQKHYQVELKESWYEELHRWDDALDAYNERLKHPQTADEWLENLAGRTRCLFALSEFEEVRALTKEMWPTADKNARQSMAPKALQACWTLEKWSEMSNYLDSSEFGSDEPFYRAALAIQGERYEEARKHVEEAREFLDPQLTALIGESYKRAYRMIVRVQQLVEMEEVIDYNTAPKDHSEVRDTIVDLWARRLDLCKENHEIWQSLLAVRSLAKRSSSGDMEKWQKDMLLRFSSICRRNKQPRLALWALDYVFAGYRSLADRSERDFSKASPIIAYSYYKYLWAAGEQQQAIDSLRSLVDEQLCNTESDEDKFLAAKCLQKLSRWELENGDTSDQQTITRVLQILKRATELQKEGYKAWHSWALMNFEVVSNYDNGENTMDLNEETLEHYLVSSVQGFFKSISLSSKSKLDKGQQDLLRLLTLWFRHGSKNDVYTALVNGFNTVSIDNWLQVVPQIIARIQTPNNSVRRMIHELLSRIGEAHPHALIYPLTVGSKSSSSSRRNAALKMLDSMKQHSPNLVDQAMLVSKELIRAAILWHEMWHEAMEDASRLFFGDNNIDGMISTLEPLHEMMRAGPETLHEKSFQQAFGRDLEEAWEWIQKYQAHRHNPEVAGGLLNQAWDLYYQVFRHINKDLPKVVTLQLQYVSPSLVACKDLELTIPGTYDPAKPVTRIRSFNPTLNVITSKQRPRRLQMQGGDGADYQFLLKGHEDLRQDERVMQLFGLVNTFLGNDPRTTKLNLTTQRYAVIPLAPNSGLIGWVPNCDTLHALVREYRESRGIVVNIEHRLMFEMAPAFEHLALMQKVEVFEHALYNTTGLDLNRVMWLKSRNSEVWLERRTNYTRSLAVMSMVGYVLGLGDRHPSNLMLEQDTGRIVHIDFGDCFEVAMERDKYPEKIPFRLTRMLVNAMEVSKIEGNFRHTCEEVVHVLRDNKDSVMALLEAFVHDPLINWRLLQAPEGGRSSTTSKPTKDASEQFFDADASTPTRSRIQSFSGSVKGTFRSNSVDNLLEDEAAIPGKLNEKAVSVLKRISNKLTGKDFKDENLDVPRQVDRLIEEATSAENLCQCYMGWCPYW